jgi:hypothetical protein
MGSRDIRHHETKKPKKDAPKTVISEPIAAPAEVEVVRKKRKPVEEER